MSSPVRICASIVTFRTPEPELSALCRSLARSVSRVSRDCNVEMVVVINDEDRASVQSMLNSLSALAAEMPERVSISTLYGHGNIGYGAAQNKAILSVQADYHLILNPDVEFDENCLDACLDHMESNPDTVAVVPQGFDGEGRYARLAKRNPSLSILILRALGVAPSQNFPGSRIAWYVYADRLPAESVVQIENASGCYMFVRGGPLKEIGGFDERFFLYFEDFDLSQRLKGYGKIAEIPGARIVHHGGRTVRRGLRRIAWFCLSGVNFFRKHGWRLW